MKIHIAVQEEPKGLGHAVWTAREAVDDRPFFCLLADNIVKPGGDVLAGMAEVSDGESVVCLREVPDVMLDKYGVVAAHIESGRIRVSAAVEKPGRAAAPSNLGLIGRYLFTPSVFPELEGSAPGYGGEIQLTDAIDALARRGEMIGFVSEHDLLDVGNPLGLVEASSVLALHGPHGDEYLDFLRKTLGLS